MCVAECMGLCDAKTRSENRSWSWSTLLPETWNLQQIQEYHYCQDIAKVPSHKPVALGKKIFHTENWWSTSARSCGLYPPLRAQHGWFTTSAAGIVQPGWSCWAGWGNGLASSVCPWFVEASPTVEKDVSCYKADRLVASLLSFHSVQSSLAVHAAGEERCERGQGQVCANLWCLMSWCPKCIRTIAAMWAHWTFGFTMWEFSMVAVTRRTMKNHKIVKIGGWALAQDNTVIRLKNCSSSQMNFAANLNRRLFTVTERIASNVRGKLGKGMLDPERVKYISEITSSMFPLELKDTGKQHRAHVWLQ